MGRLHGKVALITGAGSGIGRAAALLFAREGARVSVAEIAPEAGRETVALIELEGGAASFVETDVTELASVAAAVRATVERFERLDILYNNAGGGSVDDGPITEIDLEAFWRALRLNLFSVLLCSRCAIPAIAATGGGSIINMVSNVALIGVRRLSAYSAAKGGVVALTRAMAVDYAPQRIRVNAIAPSVTKTERIRRHIASSPAVQEIVRQMSARHLLGLGEPNDVAQMALYLASDESRIVTGQILQVDSGMTIA